ncbi:MAG: hypothetical protein IJP17_00230 [Clostridia bacterium]|nr:hypothetical protein [Clostridia bacterium]
MISKGLKAKLLSIDYNDGNDYCLSCEIFLDSEEAFTEFCCERTSGKAAYLHAFSEICARDSLAKSYIIIYGIEDDDNDDVFIYGNDACVLTSLTSLEIKQIFDEASTAHDEYISPSELESIPRRNIQTECKKCLVISEDDELLTIADGCDMQDSTELYILSWD